MKKRQFDYKWVIIALSFLMVFITLGFCSSNKSLYITAITDALHIKRSAFSINDTFRYVATATMNIFFGSLVMRFGTKKLICFGFCSMILACLVNSFASNIFGFYLGGALLGIGFSLTGTTMVGCVVNKWSRENKGTIMGFILAANGLGGALAAQIVTPIIYDETNAFGYRNAYRLVSVILLATVILIAVFFRENPKNYDNSLPVVSKKKGRGQSWVGMDIKEAKKKPYFYIAGICILLTGFVLNGITGVFAAHLKDVGLDTSFIAIVLSAHSIALTVFKFGTGISYDRFGLRFTMNVCSITAVIVTLLLAFVTNSTTGMVLALIYGIFSSLALPLEAIMVPIYASDLFGQKSFDQIMGLFVSFNVAGFAIGSPAANLCYDIFGTYNPILYIGAAVMLVITVCMQFVLNAAGRERKRIETEEALKSQETTA